MIITRIETVDKKVKFTKSTHTLSSKLLTIFVAIRTLLISTYR